MIELLVAAFPGPAGARDRGCGLPRGAPGRGRGPPGRRGCRPTRCYTGRSRRSTGRRGRPREKGDRLGTCAQIAAGTAWQATVIHVYGQDATVQIASCEALWHGSFKTAPGRLVLVRAPGSAKPYDLGLFTLDTARPQPSSPSATPGGGRSSRRMRPGKQLLGAGDACNRVEKAVAAHRPVRLPHPVAADLLVRPPRLRARRHRPAPRRCARGTAPRPSRHRPTCWPRCAASSSGPDFPPSRQARTGPVKSATTPRPATPQPRNSETRVIRTAA